MRFRIFYVLSVITVYLISNLLFSQEHKKLSIPPLKKWTILTDLFKTGLKRESGFKECILNLRGHKKLTSIWDMIPFFCLMQWNRRWAELQDAWFLSMFVLFAVSISRYRPWVRSRWILVLSNIYLDSNLYFVSLQINHYENSPVHSIY